MAKAQKHLPVLLLRPLPLFPLRPLLGRIVRTVAQNHPGLFRRLGAHSRKQFAVQADELPFALLLRPDPDAPALEPVRHVDETACDALIAGPLIKLMDLLEGRLDGDAMFFSRALRIEGDTEAVLALRNALDDIEGNLLDDIAGAFGILSPPARRAAAFYQSYRDRNGADDYAA